MSSEDKPDEYLSKSRIKTWVTCPRKFYYKYVEKLDTPETESMVRGTKIHELIEAYYENVLEYAENNSEPPTTLFSLLDSEIHDDWRDYLDPYMAHFLGFERRRWQNADNMDEWKPIAIEEDAWQKVVDDAPVMMGYADILLPAASIDDDEVSDNEGCILIDFKTGEPGSEKYRGHKNGGVFLDLGYYYMLFESGYDIRSVGGYYPKTDTLVTSDVDKERQDFIQDVAKDIADANPEEIEDYPLSVGPLCAWGEDDESRCPFYDECDSSWAEPIDNKEKTINMLKQGKENVEIADELECSEGAVSYWIRKKRLHRYRNDQ